jgi:hypothetical protein
MPVLIKQLKRAAVEILLKYFSEKHEKKSM